MNGGAPPPAGRDVERQRPGPAHRRPRGHRRGTGGVEGAEVSREGTGREQEVETQRQERREGHDHRSEHPARPGRHDGGQCAGHRPGEQDRREQAQHSPEQGRRDRWRVPQPRARLSQREAGEHERGDAGAGGGEQPARQLGGTKGQDGEAGGVEDGVHTARDEAQHSPHESDDGEEGDGECGDAHRLPGKEDEPGAEQREHSESGQCADDGRHEVQRAARHRGPPHGEPKPDDQADHGGSPCRGHVSRATSGPRRRSRSPRRAPGSDREGTRRG